MVGMAHCTIILGKNMIQTTSEFRTGDKWNPKIGRTTITIEIQTFITDIMVQERKSKINDVKGRRKISLFKYVFGY